MKQNSRCTGTRTMISPLRRPASHTEFYAFPQVGVIIPTCNAASYWDRLEAALTRQGLVPDQVLIVDSSSTDGTAKLARQAGYKLIEISRESFRHGATRQMAISCLPEKEILVFLTQDALPHGPDCFAELLKAFEDETVGAAYGRQLARESADPIEEHGRLFNYPGQSTVRDLCSREELGFRAAYFSNSFAAYRRTAFNEVGGFPTDAIVSEEVTVAARMLLAGWRVAYRAESTVRHSHDFTVREEFSRYFDIGVHHARTKWLIDQFGSVGGEGRAFVVSQARYLWSTQASLLPIATLRNASKWVSYRLGLHERWLPFAVKRALSGQSSFWLDEAHGLHETPKLYHHKLMS
jgi:rhamnosyltransferase